MYAATACLLYVVSLFIAGARWRGFLRAQGGEVTVLSATLATLGGIAAGNLTPAPGGEACRIGLVRLGGRATWTQATVAAVWDRLSELPPILVLSGMALVAVRSLSSATAVGRHGHRSRRRARAGRGAFGAPFPAFSVESGVRDWRRAASARRCSRRESRTRRCCGSRTSCG